MRIDSVDTWTFHKVGFVTKIKLFKLKLTNIAPDAFSVIIRMSVSSNHFF